MTAIEWTHRPGTKGETWNPIKAVNRETGGVGHYCAHVSEGCRNCYAEAMQGWRFNSPIRFAAQDIDQVEIFLDEKMLVQPLHWRKPRTIFVCSMTDLYGDWVKDAWIDKIKAIEALTPHHTFIELTKRPERMRDYLHEIYHRSDMTREIAAAAEVLGKEWDRHILDHVDWPIFNVWEGVSVENQQTVNDRLIFLRQTPAAVRWVSYEPALGPVDFDFLGGPGFYYSALKHNAIDGRRVLDWIVVGGESGRGARPPHPDWIRIVRNQCQEAGVAFYFKQWGAWRPLRQDDRSGGRERWADFDDDGNLEMSPITISHHDNGAMYRVGKKAAGRTLDGREWSQWPEVAA